MEKKKRGRPKKSVMDSTIKQHSIRFTFEDLRNMNVVSSYLSTENKAEIVRQALRIAANYIENT